MTERMGVLSSDGRCLQPSPLAARAMLRPAARRLAAVGIGFAGGWAVLRWRVDPPPRSPGETAQDVGGLPEVGFELVEGDGIF